MARVKKIEWRPLLIALCVFCALRPFYLWQMSNMFNMAFLPAIYVLCIAPCMDLKTHKKGILFFCLFALFVFLCVIQGYNIAFSLFTISLVVVPFLKRDVFEITIAYFHVILAFLLAGALLFWLAKMLGITLPSHSIASLNVEYSEGYTAYPPFLVQKNSFFDFYRFFGPFDEPGVVGTVSLLMLYIDNYNFKKWYNIVFLLSGFCSASFVFVIGSLIYLCYFVFTRDTKKGVALVVMLALFYLFTKDFPMFNTLFYDRMEWDASSGKFVGDNRFSDTQKDYIESIRGTYDYWFGDHGKSAGDFLGARSYLDAIISYGALFCFAYVLLFLLYAINNKLKLKSILLYLFIMLLILYQRPNFMHVSYIFFYSAYIILRTDEKFHVNSDVQESQYLTNG